MRGRVALRSGGIVDMLEYLTASSCQRCEGRAEATYNGDDNGKRSLDCNFRLCIECLETKPESAKSGPLHRHQHLSTVSNGA